MTEPVMTLDRFRALTRAYGARLERWPVAERAAATALFARSAEAKELIEQEQWLDVALSAEAPTALNAAFERKLAEIPVRHPQASLSLFRRWLWAPALGWAVAAVLGVVLGTSFADVDSDASNANESARISADEAIDALALGDIADWEESAP